MSPRQNVLILLLMTSCMVGLLIVSINFGQAFTGAIAVILIALLSIVTAREGAKEEQSPRMRHFIADVYPLSDLTLEDAATIVFSVMGATGVEQRYSENFPGGTWWLERGRGG